MKQGFKSPHLFVYKAQLNSLYSIFHRLSGFFFFFGWFFLVLIFKILDYDYFLIFLNFLDYLFTYLLILAFFYHLFNGFFYSFFDLSVQNFIFDVDLRDFGYGFLLTFVLMFFFSFIYFAIFF